MGGAVVILRIRGALLMGGAGVVLLLVARGLRRMERSKRGGRRGRGIRSRRCIGLGNSIKGSQALFWGYGILDIHFQMIS